MTQTLILAGRLPGLNEIIAFAKQGKSGYQPYAQEKKKLSDWIVWECKKQKIRPFEKQIDITVTWVCKNKRRDKDNIIAGFKFIGDGLQAAGIIKNDGWAEIGMITHRFEIAKDEKIIIEMASVD